jgi:hypothetical protein
MIYDQLPDVLASPAFNWETGSVQAMLYENATFDPTHQRASQVGQWLKKEKLQGRFVTDDGDLAGLPALFYMVVPAKPYQLILGYDDGRHDEILLGFFDQNTDGSPIQVERRGSLFVRPAMEAGESPPTYGIWLRPEVA